MATVTVYTAERMKSIEDSAIVGARLSGTHLILTTHDGTDIDVGNVKGEKGDTGPDLIDNETPVGTPLPWLTSVAPANHLLLDGSEYSPTACPILFARWGNFFGGTAAHPLLPNLKGKTLFGVDATITRLNTIGKTGGELDHTLTLAESASHDHGAATGSAGSHSHGGATGSAGSHSHGGTTAAGGVDHYHTGSTTDGAGAHTHSPGSGSNYKFFAGVTGQIGKQRFNSGSTYYTIESTDSAQLDWPSLTSSAGAHNHSLTTNGASAYSHTHGINADGAHTHTISADGVHTHTISAAGGGSAHNNMPPFMACNWIVRAA